ncbi:MAG: hypothetical protein GF364_05505 [Candidatus Lokiarchaeota archaeon]|nr:hypothetical protein [Candidatus Lokiarchaeota archaeon]
MSKEGFIPLSNQLGIPGSSYRLQLGQVNEKWAVRLAKGREILDSKVFEKKDEPPNANEVVGWVLQVLVIPNINPYQIAKSVGFIRQEAIRRSEELKQKPAISIKEAKEAKLEEIPEEAKEKLKEQKKGKGWVKEEEKKPAAATASAAEPKKDKSSKKKKKRTLPSIPTSSSSSTAAPATTASAAEPKKAKVEKAATKVDENTYIVKVPKGVKKLIIEFE